jgi:hypothetical protein
MDRFSLPVLPQDRLDKLEYVRLHQIGEIELISGKLCRSVKSSSSSLLSALECEVKPLIDGQVKALAELEARAYLDAKDYGCGPDWLFSVLRINIEAQVKENLSTLTDRLAMFLPKAISAQANAFASTISECLRRDLTEMLAPFRTAAIERAKARIAVRTLCSDLKHAPEFEADRASAEAYLKRSDYRSEEFRGFGCFEEMFHDHFDYTEPSFDDLAFAAIASEPAPKNPSGAVTIDDETPDGNVNDARRNLGQSPPGVDSVAHKAGRKKAKRTVGSREAVEAVERYRAAKALNQAEFSIQAGMTETTYRRFVETCEMQRSNFKLMAERMGLTPEALLKGELPEFFGQSSNPNCLETPRKL